MNIIIETNLKDNSMENDFDIPIEKMIVKSNIIENDFNIPIEKEKVIVKSNKGKKIVLNNLERIKEIEELDDLDPYTKNVLSGIKNQIFKNNIIDLETKQIVSSIYLKKISKIGRNIETMVWQFDIQQRKS